MVEVTSSHGPPSPQPIISVPVPLGEVKMEVKFSMAQGLRKAMEKLLLCHGVLQRIIK